MIIDEHILICHCCLTSTDFLITCSLSPGTYHRQDRQLVTVAVTCFVKSLTAIATLNKLVVGDLGNRWRADVLLPVRVCFERFPLRFFCIIIAFSF